MGGEVSEKFDINSLNEAQREAVRTLSGPVLILAGAGTGKTPAVSPLNMSIIIASPLHSFHSPAGVRARTLSGMARRRRSSFNPSAM